MSRYYQIVVDGNVVYATTDEGKFAREAAKYANVANAKLLAPSDS